MKLSLPFRKNKRRGRKRPMTPYKAGVIGAVVLVVILYGTATKFKIPFVSVSYQAQVMFANANGLRPQSFVRIAGVNVGTVKKVQPAPGCEPQMGQAPPCQEAEVTITMQKQGLPLHDDATFAIRPRIFLEGNFFIDLNPGTPESPIATSGHVFPESQGVEPVQFDQVLDTLQYNTRHNLQLLLSQYGTALQLGGTTFNQSIHYWLPAYQYTSIVGHDFLGIQPHDLSGALYNQGTVSGAIDNNPPNLQSLITDFNTTAAAFARQNVNLQNTVAELPRTLAAATPALNALNAAFPPLRTLARDLIPGVRSTGPTVDVSLPFINQLRQLVQPSELRGLTHDLAPTIPALSHLVLKTIPLMRNGVRPVSSCVANEIMPWTHSYVPDSHFNASNGFPAHPVYVESVDFLPGLAGESRVFDANSPFVRILGAFGDTVNYSLSSGLIGGALAPLVGEEPVLPPGDKNPPLEPGVPCETQPATTDLSSPTNPPPQPIPLTAGQVSQDSKNRAQLRTWAKQTPAQHVKEAQNAEAHNGGKMIGSGF